MTTRPAGRRFRAAVVGAAIAASSGCAAPAERTAPTPGQSSSSTATPPTEIVAATATEPSVRVNPPLAVHWIGGSDVEFEDRSLPAEVNRLMPRLGGRNVVVQATTTLGPSPVEVTAMVERAVADGAAALIVGLVPAWLRWGATTRCDGLTPAHTLYECMMTQPPGAMVDQRRAEIGQLIDTIVATDLPAFVYIQPQSDQALAAPRLGPLIQAAVAELAGFDPHHPRVSFRHGIYGVGLGSMDEGDEFIDMVHLTVAGVARLAGPFAADLTEAWTAVFHAS